MMGLKAIFAIRGIDEKYFFEQKDVFRYDLWFEGAEYSIFIEKFNDELLEISLLHFQKDVWPNRHVYLGFREFISFFDKIEFEIFLNRKISFSRKPIEVWKMLEKGGNDHGS